MPLPVQAVGQTCPWGHRERPWRRVCSGGSTHQGRCLASVPEQCSGATGTGAVGALALTTLHPTLPFPDHLACLAPPDACAAAWPELEQDEQHPGYSSASLRILANMPSRTIGRCLPPLPRPRRPSAELSHLPCSPTATHPPALLLPAGHSRGAIISQYYNRTARLRRRSSRPPLQQLCRAARPSLRQYDLETDPARATLEG